MPHLRRALPAANVIRLVGLLWHDSIKDSDGLECSTDDSSTGYLDDECMRYLDALIKQATEAGFWVILAARAKYAAGWNPPEAEYDVWNDRRLRKQMYKMWSHVARRYDTHTDQQARRSRTIRRAQSEHTLSTHWLTAH